MKMIKLTKNEIESNLGNLPGWGYSENGLYKDFEFENFINLFAFITKVALISEKLNHHPQWCGGTVKLK
ncbi:MAG: 4a-hydroxytetrahydrobiopterin dehydratase [Bacteroidales bacterium]|jgi:4a-hydroxytetrahydrobiopterin dehydratase|nr:4a-hydroxytetrahydrobiopterin dehydratase [Bacteroidales bacterium]HOL98503.1 4a-hydroxytetrahydrobiopterin dehydratase [Bacteroidales bacterium]HOM36133.1 4a-hydroxytetrahydrobiopterin dehydratase [Bacteroidales bacterium]HRS99581.1 4a-hydroxytetrahydrobiopterin dehydratase [Bacteroidales bacterium]HRT79663.1 4a-hydroxytetrahydrobiopterin dehydratase [Bacteroidales bacterium]